MEMERILDTFTNVVGPVASMESFRRLIIRDEFDSEWDIKIDEHNISIFLTLANGAPFEKVVPRGVDLHKAMAELRRFRDRAE